MKKTIASLMIFLLFATSTLGVEARTYKLSKSDRDYIERVVAAEARGETYKKITSKKFGTTYAGMVLVAQVIKDRADYKGGWSNSPIKVVKAKNQFAKPYKGKVSSYVKNAVKAVFDHDYRVTSGRLYYFCTKKCRPNWAKKKKLVMTIGHHKFYR